MAETMVKNMSTKAESEWVLGVSYGQLRLFSKIITKLINKLLQGIFSLILFLLCSKKYTQDSLCLRVTLPTIMLVKIFLECK